VSRVQRLVVVDDLQELGRSAAELFGAVVEAVAENAGRRCAVGLSGGSTPIPMFQALAASALDWSRVELFWVDERVVPRDDPRSNYGQAREHLLSKVGLPPKQIHPMGEPEAYERELRRVQGGGLDLVVLGLGADGHFASLFPGSPALDEKERWVARSVAPDGLERVTLTAPYLNLSANAVVLVAGKDKREVLKAALDEARCDLPIHRLDLDPPPIWLADRAAAA
jgi:6-phosphogluconolactonase